jgi:protein-disulfide isomerase
MPLVRRVLAVLASLVFLTGTPALAAFAHWPGDMSLGNPKAPIEVVEYASLSCPHCAHFNEAVFPAFKAKYIDTGKVHFTMREFLTAPAQVAAAGWLIARCAAPAKYFGVVDGVFRSQAEWSQDADIRAILLKVAQANGLTEPQFEACLKSDRNLDALQERVRRAVEVEKVDSTPTIEINGKRMEEVPQTLADLDAAIAAAPKLAAPARQGGR